MLALDVLYLRVFNCGPRVTMAKCLPDPIVRGKTMDSEKKVRVMFPPILQHQDSDEGVNVVDSDDDSEEDRPSLRERIASTISEDPTIGISIDTEAPFLPKVKGGYHLATTRNQQGEVLQRKQKFLSVNKIIRLEVIRITQVVSSYIKHL